MSRCSRQARGRASALSETATSVYHLRKNLLLLELAELDGAPRTAGGKWFDGGLSRSRGSSGAGPGVAFIKLLYMYMDIIMLCMGVI